MYDWLNGFIKVFGSNSLHAPEFTEASKPELSNSQANAVIWLADQAGLDAAAAPADDRELSSSPSESVLLQRDGDDEDAERPVGSRLLDEGA